MCVSCNMLKRRRVENGEKDESGREVKWIRLLRVLEESKMAINMVCGGVIRL